MIFESSGAKFSQPAANVKRYDKFVFKIACRLQDEDVLTEALKDFGKQYPKMLRPLIEERDEYMVWTLRWLASQYALHSIIDSDASPGKGNKYQGLISMFSDLQ